MSAYLYAVTCTADSLSATVSAEESVDRVQQYLFANGAIQPGFTLSSLMPYVHRVVVSPHPLTLSIAAPFITAAKEVCICPPSPTAQGVDVSLWLRDAVQKLREPLAGDALSGVPRDTNTLNIVVVPSDVFPQVGFNATIPPLQWPAVPTQQPTEELSLQYLDDDMAARVTVKVMRGVDRVIAEKKREIEQNVKTVDLTSQVSAAVAQTLKDIQAQLLVKDIPQLQLPAFRIEEDKSVMKELSAFEAKSRQLLEEVKKLKEDSNKW